MVERCPTSDLPPSACAHCRMAAADVSPSTDQALRDGGSRPFAARFVGTCGGCGFDVKPGDRVLYVDGTLRHVRCRYDEPRLCPSCGARRRSSFPGGRWRVTSGGSYRPATVVLVCDRCDVGEA